MHVIFDSAWYWLIAGIALIGLEVAAPGVYLLWIGLGAILVGLFVAVVPDASLPVQLIALSISMVVAMVLGARLQARKHRNKPSSLNQGMASGIGKTAIAATDFASGLGRIALHDTTYPARTTDTIQQGDTVTIRRVEGATYIVSRE